MVCRETGVEMADARYNETVDPTRGTPLSQRENLHRLVDELPEDQITEVERLVLQMLRAGEPTTPQLEGVSFEDAMNYTFTHFDGALRNLAK